MFSLLVILVQIWIFVNALEKTIQGPLNLPFGHCQTKDPVSKQFFCYIEPNSACPDKQESGREVNLFFSNKACEFERACGFAAPDIEYGDDSTYTYDYDSDYESYGSYWDLNDIILKMIFQ